MRHKLLAKENLTSDNIVTDAGQFVAQRFGRRTCIGLSDLAVIVSSELFIIPTVQLSGFSEGPTQVAIAIFTIATPFAFTVGQPLGWRAPTVGSKITDLWKTIDVTHFQHDSHRQNVSDTGYCQQLPEPFFEFDSLYDCLLYAFNLLFQKVDCIQTGLGRENQVLFF